MKQSAMRKIKKVVLIGGTGFIGKVLLREWRNLVEEWVIITRGKAKQSGNIRYLNWENFQISPETRFYLEKADMLINLNGKSVDCRYTKANKWDIFESRITATNELAQALSLLKTTPTVWMNVSSATIYKESFKQEQTELEGELGSGFSVEICKAWEQAFWNNQIPSTRQIVLRTAMVFDQEGSVFSVFKKLASLQIRFFGNADPMVSWISGEDLSRSLLHLYEKKAIGVYNLSHPIPLKQSALFSILRGGKKGWIKVNDNLTKLLSWIKRTEAELPLKSRYVVPERLIRSGFKFKYNSFFSYYEQQKN